jgi:hypothetical protein
MDDKHLGNTEEDPSGVQRSWWRRVFSTRRGAAGRRETPGYGRHRGMYGLPYLSEPCACLASPTPGWREVIG